MYMLDTNICIFVLKNRKEFARVPDLTIEDWTQKI